MSESPGPGAYDITSNGEYGATGRVPPAYSIGRATLGAVDSSQYSPGPGDYDVNEKWHAISSCAPSYTIGSTGGDRSMKISNDSPGPAAYELVKPQVTYATSSCAPAYSIGGGSGDRGMQLMTDSPGPAAYDVVRTEASSLSSAPAYSIGQARREKSGSSAEEPGPGPGSYSPFVEATSSRAPAFSMGLPPAPSVAEFNSSPGPAAYGDGQNKMGISAPAYSMGHAPRESVATEADELPGPASYHPNAEAKCYRSAAFSMGMPSSPAAEVGCSPGPAAYKPSQTVGLKAQNVPAYSIAPRRKAPQLSATETPGPAAYSPEKGIPKRRSPAYTIGHSKSGQLKRAASTTPGPGSYSPTNRSAAPSYSMSGGRQARKAPAAVSTAGPGSYTPSRPSRAPAFSMGVPRVSQAAISNSSHPGPASYTPGSFKHRSPAYSMGTASDPSLRSRRPASESPGPSSYDQFREPHLRRSAAYSIGQAKGIDTAAEEDTPGPGSYTPSRPAPRAPTWHLHRAPRRLASEDAAEQDGPGPGAHNPERLDSWCAPAFSIQGRYALNKAESLPGPGHYTNSQITRTGQKPLAHASADWAKRNVSGPTAARA